MSKIALFCNSFCGNAGVDRVVRWQAQELSSKNNEVTIFTFKKDMETPLNVDIQIIKTPKGFLFERLWRLSFILNFIKAVQLTPKLKKFDTIYSHQYPLNWLAFLAKKKYGVEYVYYHHHLNPPEAYFGTIERMYTRLLNYLTLFTAKKADRAISISKYSKDMLIKSIGLKSEVIYDEIDHERFHLGIDGSSVRKKYSIEKNPVVMYVGRIAPSKRINLLIEAFNIVKKEIPDAKLMIVGKKMFNKYYESLIELCDESVIFTGYVSDEELPFYYAACNVYATASLWEGFNLPVSEAQACGKTIAAFDIGPHREVIIVPENGLLAPAEDVDGLAKAIISLLNRKLRITDE
jgi:1,2-diacylglycerol 3-alpha-glucosyltransferase